MEIKIGDEQFSRKNSRAKAHDGHTNRYFQKIYVTYII